MGDEEGFRIKTIKLRGQVSQGLILPLSEFSIETSYDGYDLTDILGVKKWEKPIPAQLAGTMKGNFPSFIPKTDQERVQNIFKYLRKESGRRFDVTMKLDGSSVTIYYNNGEIGVCSRNIDLKETEDNTFWKTVRKLKIIEALELNGKNIAIQGELMGPNVQGNRENLKDHDIYAFDVFDIDNQEYYTPLAGERIISDLNHIYGSQIKVVPFINVVNLEDFKSVEDYLAAADIKSINHPIAEGIVFKSMTNPRVSFKVINNKFLLKEKD